MDDARPPLPFPAWLLLPGDPSSALPEPVDVTQEPVPLE
jgi:hypothetical protein